MSVLKGLCIVVVAVMAAGVSGVAAENNTTAPAAPTTTPVVTTAAPTTAAKQKVIMHPVGSFSRDRNPFPRAPTLIPGGFAPVFDEIPAHGSFPRSVPSAVTLSGAQARGILSSLYGGTSPRRIFKVLKALPPTTRRALMQVIKRTRSPSARVTIASSFLSTYAEASAEADPAVLLETATAAASEAAAKAGADADADVEEEGEADAEADADADADADAEEEGEADAEEEGAASFLETEAEAEAELEIAAEDPAFLEASAAVEADATADVELEADAEAEEQLHAEAEVDAEEEAEADADAEEEGEADAEAEQELENAADSENTIEEAMFEKMAEAATDGELSKALSFVESLSEAEHGAEAEAEHEAEAEAEAEQEQDVDMEMDVEHELAKAVSDGGVKALTGLAAALAQQSNMLESKIRKLEKERNKNPPVFERVDRGPVGRRATNPKDRFPDTGLRSWEAEARNDVMRQSPIRPDQAEAYFGVEPLPTGF